MIVLKSDLKTSSSSSAGARWRLLYGAGLIVFMSFLAIRLDAAEAPEPGSLSATGASATVNARIDVDFTNGLLSVRAKDTEVRALVEAIANKSGVEIVLDKSINGKLSVDFKDAKLEEGLKKILSGVVAGGFATEYVRGHGTKDTLDIQKVVIDRQGAALPKYMGNVPERDVLRISDMWVGEAKGEEVLFVPWGDGEGKIPVKSEILDGTEYRKGFARLRVGEDGTFYFISWGHEKAWVYGKDGQLKKAIDLHGLHGNGFDVDDEVNIYVIVNPPQRGILPQAEVIVYDNKFEQVADVRIPFSQCNTVRGDILLDYCNSDAVLMDFHYLLREPTKQSSVMRGLFSLPVKSEGTDPLDAVRPDIAILLVDRAKKFEITQDLISAPYPQEWEAKGLGSDGDHALACWQRKLYVLVGIGSGIRFYDDYGVVVLDLAGGKARYYRITEKDTFVYEHGNLMRNYIRFDLDSSGKVYQLFTNREGIHIYKYALGDAS